MCALFDNVVLTLLLCSHYSLGIVLFPVEAQRIKE